jgi:hypothetical protein
MDRLSPGDEMRPRNELRGFNERPRFYHVWFSTRRRKRLLAGDVETQVRQMLRRIALTCCSPQTARDCLDDLKLDAETDHFWQRGFGYRELADDSEGVAWYIRTQKRRLSRYER